MVEVTKKLDILKKLKGKMHPLNQLILDGICFNIEDNEPLERADLDWIDDMTNAIEPVDKNGD